MKINSKLIGAVLGGLLFIALLLWTYTYFSALNKIIDNAQKKEAEYQEKIAIQDSIITNSQTVEAAILKELPALAKQIKILQNKKHEVIFNPPNRDYWATLPDSAKMDTLSNLVNRLHRQHQSYKELLLSDTLRQPIRISE
jgi:hypothetical protein